MNPNEAAKQIGTELGQSNPMGDERLAAALEKPMDSTPEPRFVVRVNAYGKYEVWRGSEYWGGGTAYIFERKLAAQNQASLLNAAMDIGWNAALTLATGGAK